MTVSTKSKETLKTVLSSAKVTECSAAEAKLAAALLREVANHLGNSLNVQHTASRLAEELTAMPASTSAAATARRESLMQQAVAFIAANPA